MMQRQIIKKSSTAMIAAVVSTVLILIYEIFLLLVIVFLIATGILDCKPNFLSTCELKSDVFGFFGRILAVVFGLGIPLFWLAANGFSIFVFWKRQEGEKKLLIASLTLSVLAVLLLMLCWLVLAISLGL